MKVHDSVMIAVPIEDVFDAWTDVEKYPEWVAPVLERRKLSDGPVGVGTKFAAKDRWQGERSRSRWRSTCRR